MNPRISGATDATPFRALIVLIAAAILAGCGPSIEHQKSEEALKRLQKIDAATTVGVTYQQYGQLLIEAQEAINTMDRSDKPAPGKQEVAAAMLAYTEAAQMWERSIFHYGQINTCRNDPLGPLITKYHLALSEPYLGCSFTTELTIDMKFTVWPEAKRHVNEAAKQIQADQDSWSRIKASIPGLR